MIFPVGVLFSCSDNRKREVKSLLLAIFGRSLSDSALEEVVVTCRNFIVPKDIHLCLETVCLTDVLVGMLTPLVKMLALCTGLWLLSHDGLIIALSNRLDRRHNALSIWNILTSRGRAEDRLRKIVAGV